MTENEQAIWDLYRHQVAENQKLRRNQPVDIVAAYVHVLSVCCEALDQGGVSAGRLAEMIGATVSDLYPGGLQRVANALCVAADMNEGSDVD